jgi:predicted HAD superfamily phosphohydrolase YqeG
MLNRPPEATVVVGDQLFRDILGARRAGCSTVLVRPLSARDFPGTALLRPLEAAVIAYLKRISRWPDCC